MYSKFNCTDLTSNFTPDLTGSCTDMTANFGSNDMTSDFYSSADANSTDCAYLERQANEYTTKASQTSNTTLKRTFETIAKGYRTRAAICKAAGTTTGGSTTGGSTAGGSTAGGSTAGGSTAVTKTNNTNKIIAYSLGGLLLVGGIVWAVTKFRK
jgi:hypothetical protein